MNQSTGQIAIYQTDDGQTRIDVRVEQDTLWLSLLQMAELFDRDKSVISRHLKNIFDTGELPREATVAKTATVQAEGGRQVSREIEYFNLDAVISLGYASPLQARQASVVLAQVPPKLFRVVGRVLTRQVGLKPDLRPNGLFWFVKTI